MRETGNVLLRGFGWNFWVEWCGGSDTMEEILARIQQREEAAVKRERAMAYAFSHQWRANPTQYLGQAYYNLGKENWGWSWKERWIAARPWEIRAHAEPNTLKKVHSRQESKTEIKMPLSTKPALSNGKIQLLMENDSLFDAPENPSNERDVKDGFILSILFADLRKLLRHRKAKKQPTKTITKRNSLFQLSLSSIQRK
ncbi:unnamed protein product [Dovyalis caffra]|uniref:Uncharacterized protein n=1 Tax=Dovyalis caffra TaxID=77055 RepID=A0AAV1SII5_9ROSI|nr:unnamed protein product [Dovyalis caffra]